MTIFYKYTVYKHDKFKVRRPEKNLITLFTEKIPNDDDGVVLFTLHHFSSSLGLSVIFGARNLQRDIRLPRLIIYNHHLSEEVGFYLS